ncbi:MAG: branched-chain amino acid transaminase [Chromatiales bacterium]|nr:branched-chain amino acid transaminase [Chromatiales bacterium]
MAMTDRDGWIWMDGEYVPWRDAKVHVLTHTLHYGLGVFEGVRCYRTERGPAIFRLSDHTRRLLRSAHIVRMKVPYGVDALNEVQCEIVRRNGLESAYVRPLVYYGAEGLGLHASNLSVHVAIAAWEWGAYLGAENLERGIRVHTSTFARHHVNAAMSKAKANGQYINSILALSEALANGYDEALLLDTTGYVAEGSGENFFMVQDGVLYTPELTSALAGITRSTIITLARELGIEVRERLITRDEVYIADECFFTGTAAEVTPIREIDGRTVGEGKRGPITERLQALYFDQVQGRRDSHQEWLTYL